MPSVNFNRMIQLANVAFDVQNDSRQLHVDEVVIEKLKNLHPATVSEYIDGDGPVIWLLLFPTSIELMHQFLKEEISENELLDKTIEQKANKLEALYLCSALTLEDYRNRGLTKNLALAAIHKIRKDHLIKYLFVWNFSKEGSAFSKSLAKIEMLPLLERNQN
jgi:hypothetical protein